jgi:hypothetical protein
MLKELNSIAAGLLGLHGFPLRTFSASETPSTEAPPDLRNEGAAPSAEGGGNACKPARPSHSRPTFAW